MFQINLAVTIALMVQIIVEYVHRTISNIWSLEFLRLARGPFFA